LVDPGMDLITNALRALVECDEIHARIGKERFIQISGNVALTGFTAPKILWVQKNEPEVYAKARHVLLPKDYIRFKLTGEYAMDKADGAGTVLFDLKARDWSAEILEKLDIDPAWMPRTFEGTEFTGRLTREAALATDLKEGTPVAAGGGDQAAGAVGVGAVEPGIVGLTVGTSGVVFATTPSALIEPEGRLHAFCHAVPGMWHFMGVMLSAAGSLQWYRDTLAPTMGFDELLKEAETVPAGSEGLQFLPYLSGERTPYPDPLARGAFVGLTLRHTRGHMTRAVLEGVSFGLKDSFTIQNAGLSDQASPRLGGGTKARCGGRSWHPFWRRSWLQSIPPKAEPTARRCWQVSARASGAMYPAPAKPRSRSPAARTRTRRRWKPIAKPIRSTANFTAPKPSFHKMK
jgi:xylulokinase